MQVLSFANFKISIRIVKKISINTYNCSIRYSRQSDLFYIIVVVVVVIYFTKVRITCIPLRRKQKPTGTPGSSTYSCPKIHGNIKQ